MASARRAVTVCPVLLLGLLALAACDRSRADTARESSASAAERYRPVAVTTSRAEARAVQRTVETAGSLLAWEEVLVKSEQPGTVVRLHADLGDAVAAGTVLAEYDRREFQFAVDQTHADLGAARQALARGRATAAAMEAQVRRVRDTLTALDADVARAQSQLDWAAAEDERARQLFDKGLVAKRDVDSARNQHNIAAAQLTTARIARAQHPDQVNAAEAQLESDRAAVRSAAAQVQQREAAAGLAAKRLGDTSVRAPLAGRIAKRHVGPGEYVGLSTPLFTLVVGHPLKYVGTVPERHAPVLRIGQTVRLGVEAYPGREFAGTVLRLAPTVDVPTRTLALEARVPNLDGALRPGFFAKGSVLTHQDPAAVFVPAEAVTSAAGITKVFVVVDGRAAERTVALGVRRGTWVEAVGGVTAGETVATSNLAALFDGAPIEPARAR